LVLYVGLFLLCHGWILSPVAGSGHGMFNASDQLLLLPPLGNSAPLPTPSQPTLPATPDLQVRVQLQRLNTIKPLATMAPTYFPYPTILPVAPRPTMKHSSALSLLRGHGEEGGGKFKVIQGQACGNAKDSGKFSAIPRDFVFNLIDSKSKVRKIEIVLNLQAYNVPDQFEIIYRDRVVWRIDLPGDLKAEDLVKYNGGAATCRIVLDENGKVINQSVRGNLMALSSKKSKIISGTFGSDETIQCIVRWARECCPIKGQFRGWVNQYFNSYDLDLNKQVILRVHSSNQGTAWNLAANILFYVE